MRCNCCGNQLDVFDRSEHYVFERRLGYGTKYDGELVRIRFCCDCLERLIERCAVPPFAEPDT